MNFVYNVDMANMTGQWTLECLCLSPQYYVIFLVKINIYILILTIMILYCIIKHVIQYSADPHHKFLYTRLSRHSQI